MVLLYYERLKADLRKDFQVGEVVVETCRGRACRCEFYPPQPHLSLHYRSLHLEQEQLKAKGHRGELGRSDQRTLEAGG